MQPKGAVTLGSPMVTKLLQVLLLLEDITQRDRIKSSPWYTCNISWHQVSAMSVHYFSRYEHFLCAISIVALRFCTFFHHKHLTNTVIGCVNIDTTILVRCLWRKNLQNLSTKNGNGVWKMFGLHHMYSKGWIFLDPAVFHRVDSEDDLQMKMTSKLKT